MRQQRCVVPTVYISEEELAGYSREPQVDEVHDEDGALRFVSRVVVNQFGDLWMGMRRV